MTALLVAFRKENPRFYSIERVFKNVYERLATKYQDDFAVECLHAPHHSSFSTLWVNLSFFRKHQQPINHITGDIHYVLLGLNSRNVNVLTIHDCVLLNQLPKWHPKFWVIWLLWYKLPIRKASLITVISEQTYREVAQLFPEAAGKMRVIPNFVDPIFQPSPRPFNNNCPRLLFIGTTPNKNLERVAEALKGLSVELRVIGNLDAGQEAILAVNDIRYSQASGLSNEALVEEYIQCDALLFPTLYEGFGLPILEAQAIGRPVITSRLQPMASVAGQAACLVDPYSPAAIREGVEQLVRDNSYRSGLVEKGYQNVQGYELDKVVDQYAVLFRELWQAKQQIKLRKG
ncbi:glycosyltransferase family 4 protein [Flavihumibacter rivuli]|uniref:glycosyltransferase family 4 protein n=1 Tax=Flavihumibacter rivuli TaxID=2838156 RepID=UPI001BDDD887|nr:glycosyltransferase family 1 protein [Flavihumibacter rivuli]ULQ56266.1 glycosyltransferase family 4 protein [Flavihumibacter rivuli]